MAQPPLQLEESYFDVVNLEAAPEYASDQKGRPQRHGVEMHLALATVDASPDVWRVSLDIRHKEIEGETPRYRFRLRIVGFFKYLAEGKLGPEVAQLVAVNGGSILYSSAREYLLLLTSRAPWGQLSLPTMSFADVALEGTDPGASARRPECACASPSVRGSARRDRRC